MGNDSDGDAGAYRQCSLSHRKREQGFGVEQVSTAQKLLGLMVLTGMVTTLVYPTHKTAQVIDAGTRFFTRSEHTVITGAA